MRKVQRSGCNEAGSPQSGVIRLTPLAGALMSLGLIATSQAVHGQTAQPRLDEILVTATRRGETDIQTTPISVTAIGGEVLDKLNLHSTADISIMVPNMVSATAPMFNSFNPSLRGVAKSDIIVYVESPVGVAIDDFVLPSVQTQAVHPFDIESIEVLRGPQGTLFGKNTTAGVINIRTVQPQLNETSLDLGIRAGSFNTREGRFAANYGTEHFALRAAGIYQKSDGYYRNGKQSSSVNPYTGEPLDFTGDGRRLGGDDVFSGRLKALWEPNDAFSATLTYEYIRDRSDAMPAVNEAVPGSVFEALGFPGVAQGDPIRQAGQSDRRGETITDVADSRVDVDGYYLALEWTGGSLTLNSITGFREQESRLPGSQTGETSREVDGQFISTFDNMGRDDDRQTFQQEIRLTSNYGGDFNFVLGGFYQRDSTKFCVANVFGFVDFFAPGAPVLANAGLLASGFPPLADGSFNANPLLLCSRQEAEAIAGFFDATYDLTSRVTLGAGIRQSYENKKWTGRGSTFPQFLGAPREDFLSGAAVPDENLLGSLNQILDAADFARFPHGVISREQSWTNPSWRLTLDYQWTDDLFVWATRSHSVKSGAFNDQTGSAFSGVPTEFTNPIQTSPIDPEFADSWEVGLKGDLFDSRLRFGATAFHVTYDDAQRQLNATFQLPGGGSLQETLFFNAAELEVKGVELEASWLLAEGLTFVGNGSWQAAKYKSFQADTNFDGTPNVDLSGVEVDRAPKWTGTGALYYTHDIAGGGELSHNVTVAYERGAIFTYSDLGSAFDARTDSRTIFNLSSTYTVPSGRYSFRVIANNVFDRRYRTGSLAVADLWTSTSYGRPRWIGIDFTANFDF